MNWRIVRPLVAASITAVLLFVVPGSRLVAPLSAQGVEFIPGTIIEDPPAPYTGQSYVGPPENFVSGQAAALSTFVVTYNGFSPQAQAAFQAAVNIWASQIQSTVPIRVTANWTTLGPNVLGSAGPNYYVRNFANAPNANTWFAVATAKKISGMDLTAGQADPADIVSNFNSSFDWYLGTDGNAGTKYDLMSVVLHELGHGLGFLGSMNVSGSTGSWGYSGFPGTPSIYDVYAIDGSGQALLNTALYPNPSAALGNQLRSNNIYTNGAYSRAANNGAPPRLYAPATWSPGSSYSHLDESTYVQGGVNSLMTPALGPGEVIHDPGPIVRGLFRDIGWGQLSNRRTSSDFDGDGRADLAVYRPTGGAWYILRSTGSYSTYDAYIWGNSGDVPVRGDFDGDGKADVAIYRPAAGTWYILWSSTGYTTYGSYAWGSPGDVVVPDDYDGDGKTDIALYRPGSGTWYVLRSSTGFTTYASYQWGAAGDQPVSSDFDGDGRADLGLYRPSTGAWYILQSSAGYSTYNAYAWGNGGDVPVPGDYDGDGKSDVALYRPSAGAWYVLQSSTNYTTSASYAFGLSGDVPVPSDYDGDGRTDVAIYRGGAWYALLSSTGYASYASYGWGASGDIPLPRRP